VVANLPGDDLVLCQITSQSRSSQDSIPLHAAGFARGQLALDSYIRAHRLFTVEQSVILYSAATIGPAKLAEVKARICQLFA